MTKRTFRRKKKVTSNTYKQINIGNYRHCTVQNINFQYYHNDCNKHSKDCLGPTAIKVSGKD